ncbi:uncharacterized protein LOC132544858 [Ylistrum balloti]|uniref:uncharacterized protein LOC132544858 n=1 Tax=Ylistrum balloti TaxID=509963 RepID=UPI002905B144|nr:uncharacterized protein LOC132544858 [Ylistrum balloti]
MRLATVCLALAILAKVTYALSGPNVCSRTTVRTRSTKYCCFWFLGCWFWETRSIKTYHRKEYCCTGYQSSGGRCKPYCPDGCGMGTCVGPSHCNCGSAYTGKNCGTPQCSSRFPCYPGICSYPSNCQCAAAFGKTHANSKKCQEIIPRPSVMTGNALFEFYDKDRKDIIYSLSLFAPDNGTNILTWWSNIRKFNRFELEMEAFLDLGKLPERPSYVLSSHFGILSAGITYTLTKASGVGNQTEQLHCRTANQGVESGVLSCSIPVKSFLYRLDNGDVFTARFEVESGGYMRLKGGSKDNFDGKTGFKEIRVLFDFIPPVHCRDNHTCGTVHHKPPLEVVKDITRDPVTLKWSGWGDSLSNLDSYILEVFKLSGGGVFLLEKFPMKPTFVTKLSSSTNQYTYKPEEPGMYSAILGVKDRANNTRYVRELFLYDASSNISLETSSPVHVASASPESNYQWQIPNTQGKTAIEINWKGHFINKVHRDGGLLAAVRDYPPQLKNKYLDTVEKAVSKELKNPDANRTSEAIPNIDSIVRFEVKVESFIEGADLIPPTENWRDLKLVDSIAVNESVSQGDCVIAWVRAYDTIGNNATNYGMVCFDASAPSIRVDSFERDFENEFFSRLKFRSLDRDSGVAMVKWSFQDNVTRQNVEIPYRDNIPIPGKLVNSTRDKCDLSGDCNCIETGECFSSDYQFDVDHCVLYNPSMEDTETHYVMILTVFNQAMLNASTEFLIENIQDLRGMDFCARKFKTQIVDSGALTAGGISGIAICAVLVLVIIIAGLILHKTGRLQLVKERSQDTMRNIRQSVRRGHNFDVLNSYKTGGFDQDDIYMYGHQTYEQPPEWDIHPADLTINNLISVGKFAKIYEADLIQRGQLMKVVAKTLKDNYTEEDSVLMAAKINFFGTKVGRHSCILEMIGAIISDDKMGPVMVLERCGYGSVKDWLTNNKDRPSDSSIDFLFRFVYSIIQGMEYLASREIIHMRLAARNVLLTDKLEPKIAGFGPRHGDDEEDGDKKERIPVKWIAPECLSSSKNKATEKSDVWSNGIVMWEIFSFGETPYPKIRSADLSRALKRGERLGRPEFCDDTHYKIMQNSWKMKPTERPTFQEIREDIEKMFSGSGDDYYYSNFAKQ